MHQIAHLKIRDVVVLYNQTILKTTRLIQQQEQGMGFCKIILPGNAKVVLTRYNYLTSQH